MSDKEDIENLYRLTSNKVSWRIFSATIGFLMAIFAACLGWLISVDKDHQDKMDAFQPQFQQIQTQLAQVQTDLQWIKETLTSKK